MEVPNVLLQRRDFGWDFQSLGETFIGGGNRLGWRRGFLNPQQSGLGQGRVWWASWCWLWVLFLLHNEMKKSTGVQQLAQVRDKICSVKDTFSRAMSCGIDSTVMLYMLHFFVFSEYVYIYIYVLVKIDSVCFWPLAVARENFREVRLPK